VTPELSLALTPGLALALALGLALALALGLPLALALGLPLGPQPYNPFVFGPRPKARVATHCVNVLQPHEVINHDPFRNNCIHIMVYIWNLINKSYQNENSTIIYTGCVKKDHVKPKVLMMVNNLWCKIIIFVVG